MKTAGILVVVLVSTVVASQQDPLALARRAHGGAAIKTAVMEFESYSRAGTMTGSGKGRIVFSGTHYRMDWLRDSSKPITNVTVENGNQLLMWVVRDGSVQMASPSQSVRASFQRTVSAYLVSTLLPDAPFIAYRPAGSDTYEVATTLGHPLRVVIRDGRVGDVRYPRLSRTNRIEGDKIIRGNLVPQDVVLEPSDFRRVDGFDLPHKLRFQYAEDDVEQVNIRRWVINSSIDPTMFQQPAR